MNLRAIDAMVARVRRSIASELKLATRRRIANDLRQLAHATCLPTLKDPHASHHGVSGSGHAPRAVMATTMLTPPRNISSSVTLLDVSHYDAFLC
jgi:hypothetical protein